MDCILCISSSHWDYSQNHHCSLSGHHQRMHDAEGVKQIFREEAKIDVGMLIFRLQQKDTKCQDSHFVLGFALLLGPPLLPFSLPLFLPLSLATMGSFVF